MKLEQRPGMAETDIEEDGEIMIHRKTKELIKRVQDVRGNLQMARERNQRQFNKDRTEARYEEGDLVYLRNHVLSDATNRFCAKLAPKYKGPFRLHKMITRNVFELVDGEGISVGKWHCDHLKPCRNPQNEISVVKFLGERGNICNGVHVRKHYANSNIAAHSNGTESSLAEGTRGE